ncbi:chemosensory receptor c [Plakobranchus ocellatus]|uniref:Chemosensory receptor c n=1 Tax=Plakobranchus ocellatus TaxID=259542 RepID=A0AAV4BTN1_9GAST|nr:chemosensory receptor c [Plakobranchus ocellatus]
MYIKAKIIFNCRSSSPLRNVKSKVVDYTVTAQTLGSSLCSLCGLLLPKDTRIPPGLVHYVRLLWSKDMMYLVSNWITTLISLERCVCVIRPFKRFTIAPSSSAINHTPSLREDTIPESWKKKSKDDFYNDVDEEVQEIMVVGFSENRAVIHHTVDIINGAVLPVLQQALVIASAGDLAYGLKSASKVRTKGHAQNADSEKTTGSRDSVNAKQPQKSVLSKKEIRLVKVVSVLALILTICNIPRFVAVYTTLLIPEMHIGEAYENTYVFLWTLTALFASGNASVNIFIYLRVNAAYRAGFKSLFSCCFRDK